MNATILCVGKLKEKWQQEGCAEYLKRLSRYGRYEIVQIDDLREPDNASPAQIRQIIDREGKNLLARIRPNDRVIALCIQAKAPDSVGLSKLMQDWSAAGRRNVFVIGGSNGLDEAFKREASLRVSFSAMTFPHHLFRVMLLEQIYRAAMITSGRKYHK